ncbi:MAG: transglycosylase domain-containing protein [Saprospiraceae bacterium]
MTTPDQPTPDNQQADQTPSFLEKVKFVANEKWIGLKMRWAAYAENNSKFKIFLHFAGAAIGSVVLLCLLFVLMVRFGAFGKLPSKQELVNIRNDNASEVYSSDGVLLGKYYIQNRTNVAYDEISPDLINALIATEDARFFEHQGIDLKALGRVLVKTVFMQDDSGGGGSTLSQQLAKNIYPREKHWPITILVNKVQEMFIARRLEKVYSKNELIGVYLNTVPYGSNIYGVEVAARQFFNTTAKEVKTEQAAVLVGMLKANTYYNPVRNPENALKRRNTVLNQMEKYNYLTETVVDSLKQLPVEVEYNRERHYDGQATYFREHLRQELKELLADYKKPDGSEYNLYTDGIKIYTTIDSRMQTHAEKAVTIHLKNLQQSFDKHWKGKKVWGKDKVLEREMKKSDRYKKLVAQGLDEAAIKKDFNQKYKMTIFTWEGEETREFSPMDSIKYYFAMLNAGFLAMNPSNGDILAWVGGSNNKYFQYDHVKSTRQVGSIFKPIVYAKALQNGYFPCDYFDNRLVTYTEYEDWTPQNSDGRYGGLYSMAGALSNSVNSVAVDLIMRSGVSDVKELAQEMGITTEMPDAPAIALGAADLSLYEMIQVYGTLANRGKHIQPRYLKKITDQEGTLIAEFDQATPEEVLKADYADVMTKMMEMVVDSGTARRLRYLYKFQNDIAGKTGTTQSHSDGWFMGYTPNMVAGAWVGGEYPQVRFRSIREGQGANTALPIWAIFMKEVYKDPQFKVMSKARFKEPSLAVMESLECPPYVTELPVMVSEEEDGGGINQQIDDLLDALKMRKSAKSKNPAPVNKSPEDIRRQREEERRKRSEEIRKKNERIKKKKQKKKKRKKFWDKVFGN